MASLNEYAQTLVLEGSRIFWTAVEAAGGFLAGYNVPLPDGLGSYEAPIRGLVVVAVAALATKLKELGRSHLARKRDEGFE